MTYKNNFAKKNLPRLFPWWLISLSLGALICTPIASHYLVNSWRLGLVAGAFLISITALLRSIYLTVLLQIKTSARAHLTTEGHLVAGLAFSFWSHGFLTGHNLNIAIAAMLLALLISSRLFAELSIRGLQLKRSANKQATVGTAASVRITIKNSRRLIPCMGITCTESDSSRTPLGVYFDFILPGQTTHCEYQVPMNRRGEVTLPSLMVQSSFPLGLVNKTSLISYPLKILVTPRHWPLDFNSLTNGNSQHTSPTMRRLFTPSPTDQFRGLRSYQIGDHLRSIDWKTSARRQQLFVRQRDRQTTQKFAIAITSKPEKTSDTEERTLSYAEQKKRDLHFERGIELVLSLAHFLSRKNLTFDVVLNQTISIRSPRQLPELARHLAIQTQSSNNQELTATPDTTWLIAQTQPNPETKPGPQTLLFPCFDDNFWNQLTKNANA